MSVETPTGRRDRSDPGTYTSDARHGDGWVAFAGVMLIIVGTLNFIGGIAAIDDANFYVGAAQYQFGDLNTWGWVILLTGSVQFLAGLGIFVRNAFARWLGILFASLNMIAQFLFFPAQPLWALMLIAIDTLIIYGLIAYGGHENA
jgi:hypothetical protein